MVVSSEEAHIQGAGKSVAIREGQWEGGPGEDWKGGNKKHLIYNFTEGSPNSFWYLSKQNWIR